MIDIRRYEGMAKIALTEDERSRILDSVEQLMKSFDELEKIDADVEPLITVLDVKNVFREDVVKRVLSRDELLDNAPEQYDGYIQVPKTLE